MCVTYTIQKKLKVNNMNVKNIDIINKDAKLSLNRRQTKSSYCPHSYF